ncbi:MAG: putative sulfate exporter family transporter, partial [Gammaproteobacteria bacterium]|nr:putative sulfate exporter family transporter [Gammaproteobacteria bacterium]
GISRISPLMLAILLGMLVRNLLGRPEIARAGIALCLRAPLRTGIVLLGLQVTLAEILGIGFAGLAILTFALLGTFFFTLWLGERLGVRSGLTMLIATGTGICGASAIVAANTVVRDTEEAVAYALATVTLFGTIAMFSYPVLGGMLPLDARAYGLWTGASVHEVAQVVAAGFARGQATGELTVVLVSPEEVSHFDTRGSNQASMSSTKENIEGTITSVSSVEVMSPPITATPIGARNPAAAVLKATGSMPATMATVVMMIGRARL